MEEFNEMTEIRRLLGLSRVQFGRFINRSWQSIQRYDNGKQVPIEVLQNARKYKRVFLEVHGKEEEEE